MDPLVLSVPTEPVPATASELYLDLMKKLLTRALLTTGVERHTVRPLGPKSRLIVRFNGLASRFGLEAVRVVHSCAHDYLESGHEAGHRAEDAETMLGTRQLDHMQGCIADVLADGVPGDLLEAGVWRGGMTIFMRAALKAFGITDRKVWVADSFAGLPQPDDGVETFPWGAGDMAVPLELVKNNFARFGLLDGQVAFLPGFFSQTLPAAPVRRLAVLRVDADLYQSTADVLNNLYSRLSPGGFAIFDDYQNLADCRRAIDDFRGEHGVVEKIVPVDERAVCWRKRA